MQLVSFIANGYANVEKEFTCKRGEVIFSLEISLIFCLQNNIRLVVTP